MNGRYWYLDTTKGMACAISAHMEYMSTGECWVSCCIKAGTNPKKECSLN